jgi:ElaA protein
MRKGVKKTAMSNPTYQCNYKSFEDLSVTELYAILQLRNEVFVVEQQCVYADTDGKDPFCYHLMIWDGNHLAAYARLLPAGLAFEQMSIGRVVSSPAHRGKGAGKVLMTQAIALCHELFGPGRVKIGAQLYLKRFYESFGFVICSEMYLEDGIEHIEMIR